MYVYVQQYWVRMEIVLIQLIVNWEYYFEDFLKVTLEHNFKTILKSLKFFSHLLLFYEKHGQFQMEGKNKPMLLCSGKLIQTCED